jgi:hypothetical protein
VTQGQDAERLVAGRLRAALPPDYRLFTNVAWLGRTAEHRGLRDGEADIVLAHPDRGFLLFEVKSGQIARDTSGRWYAGTHELRPSPFEQATTSAHALMKKSAELPDAPRGFRPIAGHAVALPDVDLASASSNLRLIGPDIEPDLIFDRAKLPKDDPNATCLAVERAFALWAGDSAGTVPDLPTPLDGQPKVDLERRSRGTGRCRGARVTQGQAAERLVAGRLCSAQPREHLLTTSPGSAGAGSARQGGTSVGGVRRDRCGMRPVN